MAQFPWDPKPEPEAAAGNGTPTASSGKAGVSAAAGKAASPPPSADNGFSQPTMSPMASQGLALPSLPMPAFEAPGVKSEDSTQSSGRIKTEPDTQNGSGLSGVPSAAGSQMPLPNAPPFPSAAGGPDSAAMRAAAMLSKEFGSAANASINAMNTQQQQGRPAAGGGQSSNAQQYRAQMSAQAAAQLNGANGVARSQVDGSADDGADSSLFEGVLLQQQRAGQPPVELGRMEIDDLLHEQMARRAKQMEGGGLMLPLQQASKAQKQQKRDRKRKVAAAAASSSDATATPAQPRAPSSIAQLDGIDDGDDEDVKADILDDEDAINSDLDDPEDEREDDDDDDDVMGPIMLCVYDKVQRVKNKWCVPPPNLYFSYS